MSDWQQIKPSIRKKNSVIQIGSSSQNVGVSGNLSVHGSIGVNSPFVVPTYGRSNVLQVFSTSPVKKSGRRVRLRRKLKGFHPFPHHSVRRGG